MPEGNGQWQYVGEVWPTANITELCLQLTAGLRPCKQRWAPTLGQQSCERVMMTMGAFTFTLLVESSTHLLQQLPKSLLLGKELSWSNSEG